MKSIDPQTLSERENYKFLIGSIIPRPIAFVTTVSEKGVLNGAPFSYFNIVTSNPPMISIAVQRKNGERKDTARNAMYQKSFVVHVVDETNVELVNQTAKNLPPDCSEIEKFDLTPVPSSKIPVPGVKEAKIRLECSLEQVIFIGDSCDLLIGRVVYYHIENHLYEDGRINAVNLQPVSRLAGDHYAKLGEVFSLERPE